MDHQMWNIYRYFGGRGQSATHSSGNAANSNTNSPTAAPFVLLVIQEDDYDWNAIMEKALHQQNQQKKASGSSEEHASSATTGVLPPAVVRVVQTSWRNITVGPATNVPRRGGSSAKCGRNDSHYVTVQVHKSFRNGKEVSQQQQENNGSAPASRPLTISPDLVLIRNEVKTPAEDHRAKLMALMYAGVPAVNTLRSVYMFCDKPVVQAALNALRRSCGVDEFPLIDQDFFASSGGFFYGRSFPAVVKFGTAHAGFGKLRVGHHHDMDDVRGLLDLTKEGYCTAEPFIAAAVMDLRIQCIGASHFRAFKRFSVSGEWKTNTGSAVLTEIPVTPQFRRWIELVKNMFGDGPDDVLDIFSIDAIVEERPQKKKKEKEVADKDDDDKDQEDEEAWRLFVDPLEKAGPPPGALVHILEVNGCSSGLGPDPVCSEDNDHIAELVISRMLANQKKE